MFTPDYLATAPPADGKLTAIVNAGPVDGFLVLIGGAAGAQTAAIDNTRVRLVFHNQAGAPVVQFDDVPLKFFHELQKMRGGSTALGLGVMIETGRYNVDGAERVTLELTTNVAEFTTQKGAAVAGNFTVYRVYRDTDAPDGTHPHVAAISFEGNDNSLALVDNLSEAYILGEFDRVQIKAGGNTIEGTSDVFGALTSYEGQNDGTVNMVKVYDADMLEALSRGSVQILTFSSSGAQVTLIQVGSKPDLYASTYSAPAAIERAAIKLRTAVKAAPETARAVINSGAIAPAVLRVARVSTPSVPASSHPAAA